MLIRQDGAKRSISPTGWAFLLLALICVGEVGNAVYAEISHPFVLEQGAFSDGPS